MKLNTKIIKKKIPIKNVNFVTIDGITCSGKTLFSDLLKNKLEKKFRSLLLISKDIFLLPRSERIKITTSIKNKTFYNQNFLHYDLKKLKKLIYFFINGNKEGKLILNKLYNRKSGKNNLSKIFYFKPSRLIIFEGIYSNQDLKKIINPSIKILITERVYKSLFRKIERIRDKKISIQNVVAEFIRIHLTSYIKYLKKNSFDLVYADINKNFEISRNGKAKQIIDIKRFLLKHSNSK